MISGRRKDIQDDNNYIGKYGKVTYVCPCCGKVFITSVKLNVECEMPHCTSNEYVVSTPSIMKTCDVCNLNTIEVDNAMADIFKTFVGKGYIVRKCCEGHAYLRDNNLSFTYPFIELDGLVSDFIPKIYYEKFCINISTFPINTTKISCLSLDMNGCNCCPCATLEEFNKYKNEILASLGNLAYAMPNYVKSKISGVKNCNCESCDSCYCG